MSQRNFRSDLKIIAVGPSACGKTSFVNKFTKNIFNEAYKATIVSEFGFKIAEFDGKLYRVQLWDLAGQDKNATITKIFAKEAHGFICVVDATNPETLAEATKWKKSVQESQNLFKDNKMPCVLVENKIDNLPKEEQLNDTKLQEFAKENGFDGAFRCSAKTGINISEAANFLLKTVISRLEELDIVPEERKSIVLGTKKQEEDDKKEKKKEKTNSDGSSVECGSSGVDIDSGYGSRRRSSYKSSSESMPEGDLDFLNRVSTDDAITEEELIKRLMDKNHLEVQQIDNILVPNRNEFKVTIIGDSQSGKTSYINKLTNTESTDEYMPRIFNIDNEDNTYRIELQDTPSTINNPSMVKLLINYADGVIIISDVTKEESALEWKKICDDSHKPYIVIYNKIDLLPIEEQKEDQPMRVSVNEDINVNESFDCLLQELMKHKINNILN